MTDETTQGKATLTRDPNNRSGPIVKTGETRKGNPVTEAGSTHLTSNIDGKWYVVNARFEKILQTPFDTEQEAIDAAQERNNK